jgi:Alpha-1,3-glucanase catalytic domain D1/Alpha-1,3-glucanase catalytic domain D2
MALIISTKARKWCLLLALAIAAVSAQASTGATVTWTTREAEDMTTTGTILGPQYGPNVVASESSGRKCVRLDGTGQFVEFTAAAPATAIVVRYSLPDSTDGVGNDATLSLYQNGSFVGKLPLTSRYSWLYGAYPFSNTPVNGTPRNFYDEVRTNGLTIQAGDVVRLQKDANDSAAYYIIDLVDLENIAPPLAAPPNSVSIMNYGAGGAGITDDTSALVNCLATANAQGKGVWLPPGSYKITSAINLPSNSQIQGAGMWHTSLVGDPALYGMSSRRVTLKGNGSNIRLADFAITGKLNYRNDSEPNDALGGAYGTGSSISRIWVEHTKVGGWIINSQGLVVDECRFRNVIADGINLCVGVRGSVVTNCTARGAGDDCFAIWPATYTAQTYAPGLNVITHCTGQLPFLANGAAIYGGEGNRVEDCEFQDFTYGCGILISTTFPVGNNNFSGITIAQRCNLNRCGGYDPGFQWRAAVQLCLEKQSLANVNLNLLNISNSISDGVSIIAPGSSVGTGVGTLSGAIMANVNIPNYGLGVGGRHGLWARSDAIGSLTVSNSTVVEYLDSSANFTFNFVTHTNPPPAQNIFGVTLNGDGSLTLNYAATPGYPYRIETATNLAPAIWSAVAGSVTNATTAAVTFTDANALGAGQRYYRTVSP